LQKNAKKIGEDIIKEGLKMKGIRCMIQLKVQNRAAEISILPTSSALLINELAVNLFFLSIFSFFFLKIYQGTCQR